MSKRVDIINRRSIFKQYIFEIEEAHLRFERYNGTMSEEIVRLDFKRGDSVAAVLHDRQADTVLFTEQFRYSTYQKGPGWLLEIPAGSIEAGEAPEETMRRELVEEIGYEVADIQHISTFYVSPGGTSERIHLFYAEVTPAQKMHAGGGLHHESEDIHTVILRVDEALQKVASGEIVDAKTIIGLQWLQIRQGNR